MPRDRVDEIPNHRGTKINVIDYLGEQDEPNGGGPKLLSQIIQKKINVPIDHYIRFDFEAFKKLVDAMGGVEIQVDCPLYDPCVTTRAVYRWRLTRACTGSTAVRLSGYVRSRLIGGDPERERRQQRFAWAVRSQIQNENLFPACPPCTRRLTTTCRLICGRATPLSWCALPWPRRRKGAWLCRQRPQHDSAKAMPARCGFGIPTGPRSPKLPRTSSPRRRSCKRKPT
ncbi:MAG: LCP family protein [Caldilineaceae bacterium]